MTKLSYIGSVDFLHVGAALAGERDAGRPVPMKCLIVVDQGPQAKRAYSTAVAPWRVYKVERATMVDLDLILACTHDVGFCSSLRH